MKKSSVFGVLFSGVAMAGGVHDFSNPLAMSDPPSINYDGLAMSGLYPVMPPKDLISGYTGQGVFGHSDPDLIVVREVYGSWNGFQKDITFEVVNPKVDHGGVTPPPRECTLTKKSHRFLAGYSINVVGNAYDGGCYGHRGEVLYEEVANLVDAPSPGLVYGRAYQTLPGPFDPDHFASLDELMTKVNWQAIKDAVGIQ